MPRRAALAPPLRLGAVARVEAQPADMGAEDDMEALMGEVMSFRQARPGA